MVVGSKSRYSYVNFVWIDSLPSYVGWRHSLDGRQRAIRDRFDCFCKPSSLRQHVCSFRLLCFRATLQRSDAGQIRKSWQNFDDCSAHHRQRTSTEKHFFLAQNKRRYVIVFFRIFLLDDRRNCQSDQIFCSKSNWSNDSSRERYTFIFGLFGIFL